MSMRTTSRVVLGALAVMVAACSGAVAGGQITVSDARVPVPAGANGAAYLTLTNDGEVTDQLTGAATDVAETVEIHETSLEDGSMSMRPVGGVEIPAGGTVVLEPGGLHLMLVDVTTALEEGDPVTLTLTFAHAGERTVEARMVPLGGGIASENMGGASEPTGAGSEAMDGR